MMKKKLKNCCFTLVEMLTVVAIILILVSLMFPAMNKLRAQAGRLNCLNRIKDIALMNLRFAARNNGEVCLTVYGTLNDAEDRSNAGGPPGVLFPTGGYVRWMPRMANDEAGYTVPAYISTDDLKDPEKLSAEWWKFICENAVPAWNRQHNGWCDAATYHWQIKKGGESHARMAPILYGAVYFYGHFAVNANGKKTQKGVSVWDELTNMVTTKTINTMLLSNIARPSLRTYAVEAGEQNADDNAFHHISLKDYSKQINYPRLKNPGYIAGYGGGGVGKESIESVGYAAEMQSHPRFHDVKRDVEEGRHDGYTLHSFFDGHAEIIDVKTVGSLQLKPGESTRNTEHFKGKKIYGWATNSED